MVYLKLIHLSNLLAIIIFLVELNKYLISLIIFHLLAYDATIMSPSIIHVSFPDPPTLWFVAVCFFCKFACSFCRIVEEAVNFATCSLDVLVIVTCWRARQPSNGNWYKNICFSWQDNSNGKHSFNIGEHLLAKVSSHTYRILAGDELDCLSQAELPYELHGAKLNSTMLMFQQNSYALTLWVSFYRIYF